MKIQRCPSCEIDQDTTIVIKIKIQLCPSCEIQLFRRGATTLGENASLQVRRRGVRCRNWSRASSLQAATSPGTPFFSFFPFFSSLVFFLFWPSKMENSCGPTASRRGGEQQKPASGEKKILPRAPET